LGFTSTKVSLSNPQKPRKSRTVELLVDTGAMYSRVPRRILKDLKIEPLEKRRFTLASGQVIERQIGGALYKINGSLGHAPIIFGEKRDQPLLGVTTLEALGLEVDPIGKKLRPAKLFLL
jgi:aspartyl protease family protein